jgi:mannose-6-phosphate isomerase-like protein (cupin superfamily)
VEPGWKAVHLDDTEAVPWNASEVTWRPVRQSLGAQIIGLGAYTAERVGQELIEAHTETQDGRGHQEIYVVLRGRASFTLNGSVLDAPAGTFVLVEAHVHRHATAVEPHTAVLALGGPPTFEPSSSEWIERARWHLRTDPELARRIIDDLRATHPHSPGIEIGEALLALGRDDRQTAERILTALLSREPALAEPLATDADLGPLVRSHD